MVKPADKDFFCPQLLQPQLGGKRRGLNEDKVGLARKHTESQDSQRVGEPFAGRNDLFEVHAVIIQVIQRGLRGDLAQAVDIVTVADFVEGRNQVRVANEISDALEAKRIRL